MKLYEEYHCALKRTYAEGKKMRGAIFAECVKRGIQEKLEESNVDDYYIISDNNVYVKGSPYEYDLLILKKNCNPDYKVVYNPQDVVACIECKAGGLYNLESETESIAKAANKLYVLNNAVSFGYITLWENTPINKVKSNGDVTIDQWKLTYKYLSDKIISDKQLSYAVTLKKGKNIIGPVETEFTEFVNFLIE